MQHVPLFVWSKLASVWAALPCGGIVIQVSLSRKGEDLPAMKEYEVSPPDPHIRVRLDVRAVCGCRVYALAVVVDCGC